MTDNFPGDYVSVTVTGRYDGVPVSCKASVDLRGDHPANPITFAGQQAVEGFQRIVDRLAAKTPAERRQMAEELARMKD